MENLYEILYNEKAEHYSLWKNGKVIKVAKKEQTLLDEVSKRGGEVTI